MLCGAEATVPRVTHGFALMWEGARPGGEQSVPEGICSWDPVGWVLMGGGRHFEGGRPQRRREVVVGACVPGGEEAVGAGAPRWWKGGWGRRLPAVRGVVEADVTGYGGSRRDGRPKWRGG